MGGWNDTNELRVLSSGQAYVAPVGTALPTNPTSTLSSSLWTGLGLLTEDGVKLNSSPKFEEMMAWQVRGPVRREMTGLALTAAFAMEQWNEANVPLAFGGGVVSLASAGVYRYDWPAGSQGPDERALVIDGLDGLVHQRLVIPRGSVTESVETEWKRGSLSILPITFAGLEPTDGTSIAYLLTDDAASFIAGS